MWEVAMMQIQEDQQKVSLPFKGTVEGKIE
jgi:hypothetical protein